MLLDANIKQQLAQYLELLENPIIITVSGDNSDMHELVDQLVQMSNKITKETANLSRENCFSVSSQGSLARIIFAGVPLGHEFNSLVLALLQVSGRALKVSDDIIRQIADLPGHYNFESYISLSCHNCPDVVQALNLMAVINPNITHTMIDGGLYPEEVAHKDIMAVPTVYLNGEMFSSGRMSVEEILKQLGSTKNSEEFNSKDTFDVLVIGGGPAGATSAIYTARKGLKTGIVAERFGGQVRDTLGIENITSILNITGPTLADNMEAHLKDYDIDMMSGLRVTNISKDKLFSIKLDNNATLTSKTVIIATGAKWRNIGCPGESEYQTKGVAYCPHCDGPLFKGKDVAVIGGGNSGIEAAIDLAGVVNHVSVIEYLPELKADSVLQEKLKSLDNVTVYTNSATLEITGDGNKVNGITFTDRDSDQKTHVELSGVFVQIGLVPNTMWLDGIVDRDPQGQIITDQENATNIEGLYAAGDCTNSQFKQIIIGMGSGATAALSAFNYLIKNFK
ncbi:MAG: alkyl hydroperoxide reductase subunit F [Erysipelotrichaceae bacterium]